MFSIKISTLLFLSFNLVSFGATANPSDSNLSKEGPFVLVKRSACLKNYGSVVATKKWFMCDGGKYNGYITSGPEIDPHVTTEGNKSIVTLRACLANKGKVTTDKRYYICIGGKYDGFITSAGN